MATIKEKAINYIPFKVMNVSDLDEMPLNLEVHDDGEGTDKDGKAYTFQYIMLDNVQFRVSNPVLEQIQTILELKPEVTKVKVEKSGDGKQTRYKVKALD